MLMHALEVLCNENWCCIFYWQFDMQFSYATHLAHPVLCRPTHLNISGYASARCTLLILYKEPDSLPRTVTWEPTLLPSMFLIH